jgi:hypothetical protein
VCAGGQLALLLMSFEAAHELLMKSAMRQAISVSHCFMLAPVLVSSEQRMLPRHAGNTLGAAGLSLIPELQSRDLYVLPLSFQKLMDIEQLVPVAAPCMCNGHRLADASSSAHYKC